MLSSIYMYAKEYIIKALFKAKMKRLVSEGIWIASSQIGTAIGILLLTRFITEIYSPDLFGKANLYLGISTFMYSFFCAPLMWAILRFYSEYARTGELDKFRKTIVSALYRSTIPLIIILILFGALYSLASGATFDLFAILAGLLIIDVIRSKETSFLAAARKQRENALWTFFDTCSKPLVAIIFGYFFVATTQSLLMGYLAGSLFVLLTFRMFIKREEVYECTCENASNERMRADINSYVIPLVPLAVISGITSLSDRYIIGGILGFDQAGIYVAAYGLVGRPFLMSGIIIEQLIRPKYFEDISAGNFCKGKKIINMWLLAITLVCAIGVILFTTFNNDIARLLLGEKYWSSAEIMPWIAIGHALLVISYVFEITCYAYKKTRLILYIRVSGVVACLAFSVPLIYYFGMWGAAVSVPLYYGSQLITAFILSKKIIHGANSGNISKAHI